jgi:hypothetical protein
MKTTVIRLLFMAIIFVCMNNKPSVCICQVQNKTQANVKFS